MSYKVIGNEMFQVGESPRWNHEQKMLWFTDVLAKKLHNYNPQNGKFSELYIGRNVSGFCFNRGGGFIVATHQGVYFADNQGKLELIAEETEGHYLKCNDCIADAKGRFIFGTSFYDPGMNHGDLGNLYSMDSKRNIRLLDSGIKHSNGLAFSPDQKLLYYTDCAARIIYVYDYDLEHGDISNKRIFVKVPRYEGLPDGMAVDSQGFVWSAQWYGGAVIRYKPDGSVDFVMRTPGQQTSALAFGGEGLEDIFVTSASHWAYLEDAPTNYEYDVLSPGGNLYCFNYGVKGLECNFADIS